MKNSKQVSGIIVIVIIVIISIGSIFAVVRLSNKITEDNKSIEIANYDYVKLSAKRYGNTIINELSGVEYKDVTFNDLVNAGFIPSDKTITEQSKNLAFRLSIKDGVLTIEDK